MKTIEEFEGQPLDFEGLLKIDGGGIKDIAKFIQKDVINNVFLGGWVFDYFEGKYLEGYDSYDCNCG